jgi:hypothetical protein
LIEHVGEFCGYAANTPTEFPRIFKDPEYGSEVEDHDLLLFIVEHTKYGWLVSIGGRRVGIHATQEQALADVGNRRADLTAKGERSRVLLREPR